MGEYRVYDKVNRSANNSSYRYSHCSNLVWFAIDRPSFMLYRFLAILCFFFFFFFFSSFSSLFFLFVLVTRYSVQEDVVKGEQFLICVAGGRCANKIDKVDLA